MKKKAFTMIELVFVIVVLGILAAMAMPRMERDLRQEAADNVLSAIRYTQHLALVDDKHMFNNARWQRKFWQIQFSEAAANGGAYYIVGSDNGMNGSIEKNETVMDPANGKRMFHLNTNPTQPDESPNVVLGKQYDVTDIDPSGGCANKYIGFDHLGRPYGSAFQASNQPDCSGLITSDCNMTFSSSNASFTPFSIIITKETGYAYIDGQPDS